VVSPFQYKVRAYIQMKSSKACKREIKSVMNTAGNVSLRAAAAGGGGEEGGGREEEGGQTDRHYVSDWCFFLFPTVRALALPQEQFRVPEGKLPEGGEAAEQLQHRRASRTHQDG